MLWSLVHFLLGATVALPDPFHFSERDRTWQDYSVAALAELLGCLWLAGGVLTYTGHRRGLMLLIPIAALEAGNYAAAIVGGRNPLSALALVLVPLAIAMASAWAWDASRPDGAQAG